MADRPAYDDKAYRERRAAALRDRAERKGGDFDSIFKSGYATFAPKEGTYRLRVLPPTWKNAEHFGYDITVHYGIGADDSTYICPRKALGEACPVCDERTRLSSSNDKADEELSKSLRGSTRIVVWVVDRDHENEGPKLWAMPMTVDKELAILSQNKRTGETLFIDDPDEGFDFEFTRVGAGKNTKYSGMRIDRDPSPLGPSERKQREWMDYTADNPIPDCLNIKSTDYLRDVFMGRSTGDDDDGRDDDRRGRRDDEPAPRGRRGSADDDAGEPAPRARRGRDDDRSSLSDRYSGRADEGDDPAPRGRRSREDDEATTSTRRSRDLDDDPEPRGRGRDDDPEPRGRRRSDDDGGDEPAPRARRGRDEDDEPAPRARRGRDADDDPEPRGRGRGRDEDDDPEPAPRGKSASAAERLRDMSRRGDK